MINLGAGFDNRFQRMDNGEILWFDVDLPDTIAARKKAFPKQDRVTMIAGNALENEWCGEVNKVLAGRQSKPVFIAEGLFMYLTFDQIRTLLNVLKDNFPEGGTLIAEQNCKLMQKNLLEEIYILMLSLLGQQLTLCLQPLKLKAQQF